VAIFIIAGFPKVRGIKVKALEEIVRK